MKNTFLVLILSSLFHSGFSQDPVNNNNYNLFDCKGCNHKYFVSTSSGIRDTPIGIKFGIICRTGAYVGIRFGSGEINPSDGGNSTKTTLFSITGGITEPVYINNDFNIYAFLGGGYGQWWPYRWEGWTREGYEIEGGFIISYKRFLLNLGTNMLDGYKTYATWDFTVGLGYRF